VGFFERTSITDSVPSPLRAIQPSVLQFSLQTYLVARR
jgi:hypothetical protein